MKHLNIFLTLIAIILFVSCSEKSPNPSVLLITGGHSFDTTEFFDFFLSLEDFEIDTMSQPAANEFLLTEEGKSYDTYVFYDMWNEITDEQKDAYLDLTSKGKGFLFLHHSLVSYQDWPEFKSLIGGRYHRPAEGKDSALFSNYKHDIELRVNVLDDEHSITLGMADFSISDEGYGNLDVNDEIVPLLTTDHPDCHPVIGWANQFQNSKVVYLIFGHDKKAYEDEDFGVLVKNSIKWVSKNEKL
jgi:hypothetical protein